ncbi:E3 ubiquitin-protein ligase ORTHRUS 2-like [Aristolochia californica]|uniref:E3 ubiquitin-protein ligase ORTHRUS 2-like n=1 Tax=Aristolochia californica TaxID=171875 RepID=UPI0035D89851
MGVVSDKCIFKDWFPYRCLKKLFLNRSHKEKGSAYAPESGVRYDGIYRIEKCWRKVGIQGYKVCRYLFVRCDNEPAPWTSDEHGDRPRSLPAIKELKKASDVTERKDTPAWDYDEEHGWSWTRPSPTSRKSVQTANPEDRKRARKAIRQAQNFSVRERLLKEFSCLICRKEMILPLTTPCAHNFCKLCLEGAFAGQKFVHERTREGGRTLRAQKNVMKCPSCPTDISDFLQNPQVNRELMDVIESLQRQSKDESGESPEGAPDGSEVSKADMEDDGSELGPEGQDLVKRGDKDHQTPQKRKKSGNGICMDTEGEKKSKESTKSDEILEAGNDSPSGPLHARSDTEDS